MRLRGLGVIDDAVLELGPGLTVVTGETGAGKTMVVQGLALLLGGRADAGLGRPGPRGRRGARRRRDDREPFGQRGGAVQGAPRRPGGPGGGARRAGRLAG